MPHDLFWWTFVSESLGTSARLRLLFETQTHDDYESDAGDLADQGQMGEALAREQVIQREEEEWLSFNLEHTCGTRPQRRLKVARQFKKNRRWLLDLDNSLQSRPLNAGVLKKFQAPLNWRDVKGEECLAWPALATPQIVHVETSFRACFRKSLHAC